MHLKKVSEKLIVVVICMYISRSNTTFVAIFSHFLKLKIFIVTVHAQTKLKGTEVKHFFIHLGITIVVYLCIYIEPKC